jgi:hypothetical protein
MTCPTQPQFTWDAVLAYLSGVPSATNKDIAAHFKVNQQDATNLTALMRKAGAIGCNKTDSTKGAPLRYFQPTKEIPA